MFETVFLYGMLILAILIVAVNIATTVSTRFRRWLYTE